MLKKKWSSTRQRKLTSSSSTLRMLQHWRSVRFCREVTIASATVCMCFRRPIFWLLLQCGVSSFLSWKKLKKSDSLRLGLLLETCQSNKEQKDEDFYYLTCWWGENEALQPFQKAVCTSVMMAICGIGDWRWPSILSQSRKSATANQHGKQQQHQDTRR